jgi:hypothetical protein
MRFRSGSFSLRVMLLVHMGSAVSSAQTAYTWNLAWQSPPYRCCSAARILCPTLYGGTWQTR